MSATTSLNRNDTLGRTSVCLDRVHARIGEGRVEQGLLELLSFLDRQRSVLPREEWEIFLRTCLAHPLAEDIFQEPMTARSFRKPRGYPGDAELLDFIYRLKDVQGDPQTTSLGKRLHRVCVDTPPTRAVRSRRRILAGLVDQTAARVARPRVLSIAAGHLREAELSMAVIAGAVGEYVAFDQDALSLEVVEKQYGRLGVRADHGSVRDILAGKRSFGGFDLVYAAGLYDYLQDKTARRLTAILFEALGPGGKLLVANFLPGVSGRGYMESFMGWNLIYRSPWELADVAAEIPRERIQERNLFVERDRSIVFLEIERKP